MFRLVRWLCFPLARRFNTYPLLIYYILALILVGLRRWVIPLSAQAQMVLPPYFMTSLMIAVLVVVPVVLVMRNRDWIRRAPPKT